MANSIVTNSLSTVNITTGTIRSTNNNVIFDLTNGSLTMKKGTIDIAGKFSVDQYGKLYSIYGEIGGFEITDDAIYNETINLNMYGITYTRDEIDLGYYGTGYWSLQPTALGLTTGIEKDTAYLGWGHRDGKLGDYTMKLIYTSMSIPCVTLPYTYRYREHVSGTPNSEDFVGFYGIYDSLDDITSYDYDHLYYYIVKHPSIEGQFQLWERARRVGWKMTDSNYTFSDLPHYPSDTLNLGCDLFLNGWGFSTRYSTEDTMYSAKKQMFHSVTVTDEDGDYAVPVPALGPDVYIINGLVMVAVSDY